MSSKENTVYGKEREKRNGEKDHVRIEDSHFTQKHKPQGIVFRNEGQAQTKRAEKPQKQSRLSFFLSGRRKREDKNKTKQSKGTKIKVQKAPLGWSSFAVSSVVQYKRLLNAK